MKGILFKPDMIKAIAEGRKTVTRRLQGLDIINKEPDKWELITWKYKMTGGFATGFFFKHTSGKELVIKPRFHVEAEFNKPDETRIDWETPMFMKAIYARYFLLIKDARPERLQKITWNDCLAEGILDKGNDNFYSPDKPNLTYSVPQGAYIQLWDSINKENKWETNPWVWRIEFEVRME